MGGGDAGKGMRREQIVPRLTGFQQEQRMTQGEGRGWGEEGRREGGKVRKARVWEMKEENGTEKKECWERGNRAGRGSHGIMPRNPSGSSELRGRSHRWDERGLCRWGDGLQGRKSRCPRPSESRCHQVWI